MLGIGMLGLVLTLMPYRGPTLNRTVPGTAKFAVSLSGAPGQTVRVRAVGVPDGYIASFCTNLVCAPFAVSLTLPKSGHASIELALIETAVGARKPRAVSVVANGAAAVSIAFERASR